MGTVLINCLSTRGLDSERGNRRKTRTFRRRDLFSLTRFVPDSGLGSAVPRRDFVQ